MDTIVDLLTIDTSKYFTTVTKLSPKNKDTQLLVLFYGDSVQTLPIWLSSHLSVSLSLSKVLVKWVI